MDLTGTQAMGRAEKNVTTAVVRGQKGRAKMSYWHHRPQPSLPIKKQSPSISQIKELLLDNHGIVAEAIANIIIEEERIIGYVKEEGEWYKFTVYKH